MKPLRAVKTVSPRPAPKDSLAGMVLGLVTAVAAFYVWTSGYRLPDLVASHFGSSGAPNGFMPRRYYVSLMTAVVVLVPLLMSVGMGRALRRPDARINLPNGDYWLAPERREATMAALLGYLRVFAAAMVLFLSYVHGLVVSANQAVPPWLDNALMLRALGALLLFLGAWIVLLIRRFRA